jgi:NOL1/NOP2/sun family putative RNA methylase
MQEYLGADCRAFINSLANPPLTGLRANTLKVPPAALTSLLGNALRPVPWCPEGFYYDAPFRPAKHPLYHAGLYYIQEPSAMAPASILDVRPGDRVLDICAAPGGKTTQLAARLGGQGIIIANDISASRCKALLKNLELSGARNAAVLCELPERLAERFPLFFNRILIDAPCSGEGMFRRDPDVAKAWREDWGQSFARRQRAILRAAALMLDRGGLMLYSTCTFNPDENERLIEDFLNENKNFSYAAIPHERYGIEPCRTSGPGCGRIWPHKQQGEGHFAALLRKDRSEQTEPTRFTKEINGETGDVELYRDFSSRYLNITEELPLTRRGTSLFHIPGDMPSLDGLRVLRAGFYMGEFKNKRFEPSQAFAMGLRGPEARYVLNFSQNDKAVVRYLKGESLDITAAEGWNLVCAEGFPLGWAKVAAGRCKNKYHRNWLMN